MTDLVERLRRHKVLVAGEFAVHPDCEEAAARIERLEKALREIVSWEPYASAVARAALEEN